jgi:hypothetical protein
VRAARAPVITVDAWRAELERVMTRPRPAVAGATVNELCAATGWSRRRVCDTLQKIPSLVSARRPIVGIDGRQTTVPCYRIPAP